MEVVQGPGGTPDLAQYQLVGVLQTFRVNSDSTTTPIVQITAYSVAYGVTFTWFITEATFQADGAKNAAEQMTTDVNAVCGYRHVQEFRTEQDQDRSGLLVNNAVITVGTDDESITAVVTQRMDHLNTPATFGLIDNAWKLLVDAGAPTS